MIKALLLALFLAADPEPTLDPEPKADQCGCLHWIQVDGGYVCERPFCPITKPPEKSHEPKSEAP